MLFIHELPGVFLTFFSRIKSYHVWAKKVTISDVRILPCYYTKKLTGVCFSTTFYRGKNVTAVFCMSVISFVMRIIPCYFHISYRGYVLNNNYFRVKVTVMFGTYVTRFAVLYITRLFTQKLSGGLFQHFFFG